MRIGELAERAGISAKAIRYYEQIGIMTPPERSASGYRAFDEAALGRLGFVRAAQALGLTLGEIRQIIAFRDNGQAPCAHVTDLVQRHAADLEARIRELSSCAASSASWPSGPPPWIRSTARPSGSATSSPDPPGIRFLRRCAVLGIRRRWGRGAIPRLAPTRRPGA